MKNGEIAGILALFTGAIIFIFKDKKPNKVQDEKTAPQKTAGEFFTSEDAEKALLKIAEKYGTEIAKVAERIFRLETGHFKSRQYKLTGSAGMEAGAWKDLPADIPTINLVDNHTKKLRPFIKWAHPYQFLDYLIQYVERHEGNWARWNTLNKTGQEEYRKKVNSIKNRTIK